MLGKKDIAGHMEKSVSTHFQRLLKKMLLYHVSGQAMELCTERIKVYFSSTAVNIEWTVWIWKKLTTCCRFTCTFLICVENNFHLTLKLFCQNKLQTVV